MENLDTAIRVAIKECENLEKGAFLENRLTKSEQEVVYATLNTFRLKVLVPLLQQEYENMFMMFEIAQNSECDFKDAYESHFDKL